MGNARGFASVLLAALLVASNVQAQAQEKGKAPFSMGNGEKNWIDVAGVSRENSVLTFPEVKIDGNGWLVVHRFENGAANGDKYVGKTYVKDSKNANVSIEVLKGLTQGEMFIVMLHRDGSENKALDFIFIDETNVMDRAVFEGGRMIGHAIPAP
jgi:hypothetical protein